MTILTAVLCDAATNYSEKLNLLGTFDTIFVTQFPAAHPQCSVALRMVFQRAEEGVHELKINFVDDDGGSIMPSVQISVEVRMPEEAHFISRNIIVNLQQLKFEKPGLFGIDIAVDGRHEISIPLSVRQMPAKPA